MNITLTRRLTAVAVLSAALAAAAVPAAAPAKSVPTISMSGATGSAPLLGLLAKAYVKSHPGQVRIKLAQGGGELDCGLDLDSAAGHTLHVQRDRQP